MKIRTAPGSVRTGVRLAGVAIALGLGLAASSEFEYRGTDDRAFLGVDFRVADDGTGFSQDDVQPPAPGRGRGLRNIAARAAELGGQARTVSTPGVGTTIEWTVPVDDEIED